MPPVPSLRGEQMVRDSLSTTIHHSCDADYADQMQATVHRFDPATGSGAVVTDAGVLMAFSGEAFAGSQLRHLRVGQRLSVTVGAGDAARQITTMHLGTVGVVVGRPSRP